VKYHKIWVFDSSPVIYLNKVGLAWVLEELEGEKIVPPAVYEQVVPRGKARGDADALLTERLVEQGVITVVPVESDFKFEPSCTKANWTYLRSPLRRAG